MSWLQRYGIATVKSWDFKVGVALGAVALLLGTSHHVRQSAPTVLIAESALGTAIMAVVFAALAVFATFFDGPYRLILEMAGGFRSALMPYYVVAACGGLTAGAGLILVIAMPLLSGWTAAIALGVATWLCSWTIAGMVDLTEITLTHASNRAQLMGGADAAEAIKARRLREEPSRAGE